jgi:acetyl-CoA carboxylase biotin carboxyl carrier protein
MDFNQIQELIRLVSKSKISEFIFKEGDFKLVIRNQQTAEHSHQMVMQSPQPMLSMPAPQMQISAPTTAAESTPAPTNVEKLAPAPAAAPEAAASSLVTIKSPMVGTFYRSASPDKPAYIKIGDTIDVGTTVCMIEAMKLFNEIESEIKGKIVKILVDDAKPVEYDQPLFLVEPS